MATKSPYRHVCKIARGFTKLQRAEFARQFAMHLDANSNKVMDAYNAQAKKININASPIDRIGEAEYTDNTVTLAVYTTRNDVRPNMLTDAIMEAIQTIWHDRIRLPRFG